MLKYFTLFLCLSLSLIAEEGIYQFTFKDIDGKEVKLSDFKDKNLLIVNTASRCGLTKHYKGLQKLHEQHKELVVIGFPCNQFGKQEPGTLEQIKEFCTEKFNVTFLMAEKVNVNGDKAHPLFVWLKDNADIKGKIKWNFNKFLVTKNQGEVKRFEPKTKPELIAVYLKGIQ